MRYSFVSILCIDLSLGSCRYADRVLAISAVEFTSHVLTRRFGICIMYVANREIGASECIWLQGVQQRFMKSFHLTKGK